MYRVIRTKIYRKKLIRLSPTYRRRVYKFEQILKENPFEGKPLHYTFFREKKFNGNRLLYLIYKEENIIVLAIITNKKDQQRDINYILSRLKTFEMIVKKINKRD